MRGSRIRKSSRNLARLTAVGYPIHPRSTLYAGSKEPQAPRTSQERLKKACRSSAKHSPKRPGKHRPHTAKPSSRQSADPGSRPSPYAGSHKKRDRPSRTAPPFQQCTPRGSVYPSKHLRGWRRTCRTRGRGSWPCRWSCPRRCPRSRCRNARPAYCRRHTGRGSARCGQP